MYGYFHPLGARDHMRLRQSERMNAMNQLQHLAQDMGYGRSNYQYEERRIERSAGGYRQGIVVSRYRGLPEGAPAPSPLQNIHLSHSGPGDRSSRPVEHHGNGSHHESRRASTVHPHSSVSNRNARPHGFGRHEAHPGLDPWMQHQQPQQTRPLLPDRQPAHLLPPGRQSPLRQPRPPSRLPPLDAAPPPPPSAPDPPRTI